MKVVEETLVVSYYDSLVDMWLVRGESFGIGVRTTIITKWYVKNGLRLVLGGLTFYVTTHEG